MSLFDKGLGFSISPSGVSISSITFPIVIPKASSSHDWAISISSVVSTFFCDVIGTLPHFTVRFWEDTLNFLLPFEFFDDVFSIVSVKSSIFLCIFSSLSLTSVIFLDAIEMLSPVAGSWLMLICKDCMIEIIPVPSSKLSVETLVVPELISSSTLAIASGSKSGQRISYSWSKLVLLQSQLVSNIFWNILELKKRAILLVFTWTFPWQCKVTSLHNL